MFLELLRRAFEKRESLFNDPNTNCFRLFNLSGEGIDGISIDLYREYLLVQYFNKSVSELLYRDTRLKTAIRQAVSYYFQEIKGILLKDRIATQSDSNYQDVRKSALIEGVVPSSDYTVMQNGITINVDLVEGLNTGLFLDMREVREKLALFYKENRCRSMLNLFCYTAVFSAHALKNGVEHSINVDLSKSALKRAKKNYRFNDLKCDDRDFFHGDALEAVKYFIKKDIEFSYIVFDPPTFARNKRKIFSVNRDFRESLVRINRIIPEGFILTSINSKSISKDKYLAFHPEKWELVMFANESADFISDTEPYLKVGLWQTE